MKKRELRENAFRFMYWTNPVCWVRWKFLRTEEKHFLITLKARAFLGVLFFRGKSHLCLEFLLMRDLELDLKMPLPWRMRKTRDSKCFYLSPWPGSLFVNPEEELKGSQKPRPLGHRQLLHQIIAST